MNTVISFLNNKIILYTKPKETNKKNFLCNAQNGLTDIFRWVKST